jgi:hypothetical protein
MATEEQIKDLAHAIWEQEGRPEGKHLEHYFRAKRILEGKEATNVIILGPSSPVLQLAAPLSKRKTSTQLKRRGM